MTTNLFRKLNCEVTVVAFLCCQHKLSAIKKTLRSSATFITESAPAFMHKMSKLQLAVV